MNSIANHKRSAVRNYGILRLQCAIVEEELAGVIG